MEASRASTVCALEGFETAFEFFELVFWLPLALVVFFDLSVCFWDWLSSGIAYGSKLLNRSEIELVQNMVWKLIADG